MLEKTIEKKVTDILKAKGWLSFKFTSPACRGVPDRIYFREGVCMCIEFKTKGKLPTPLQFKRISELRAHGVTVLIIDSVDAINVIS